MPTLAEIPTSKLLFFGYRGSLYVVYVPYKTRKKSNLSGRMRGSCRNHWISSRRAMYREGGMADVVVIYRTLPSSQGQHRTEV